MNFKFWKLLFILLLFSSILVSISAFSWFTLWIGLEINMLSIIPLMNSSKNMYSTESSLKYFIVQAMASSLLLLGIILMSLDINMNMTTIMNSALLIKIGSAPFHFWFPEVMEGQMWTMCFNLMTTQKIAPFMLLNYNMNSSLFFSTIIIFNMIISAFLGFNQISLRKILTYSSINHIGWMMASILMMKSIWLYYFTIYTIMLTLITLILNNFNVYYMKQIIKIELPTYFKLLFMMNFFSMGGLPPFIGFLPKWLTIQMLALKNFTFLITVMVILTLLTLFYYIRMMMSTLTFMNLTTQKTYLNKHVILVNFISLFLLPLTFIVSSV